MLTHDARFALWDDSGGVAVCGFVKQRPTPGSEASGVATALEPRREADLAAWTVNHKGARQVSLPELVASLFGDARVPVELDALVNAVASLIGVEDDVVRTSAFTGVAGDVRDERPTVVEESERRAYLARLWAEINALPLNQRSALLLNLTDAAGNSQLELLVLTAVTTIRGIAATLELSPEEFARLWHELPLDDNAVAGRLGLARQQIINLRKSARQRLARRMRAAGL